MRAVRAVRVVLSLVLVSGIVALGRRGVGPGRKPGNDRRREPGHELTA